VHGTAPTRSEIACPALFSVSLTIWTNRILRLEGLKIPAENLPLPPKEQRKRDKEVEGLLTEIFSAYGGELTYINVNALRGMQF
jgi:hypothetical protein